jgi:hypothetical protein
MEDLARERIMKIGGWIQTYTNIQFWPQDPSVDDIDIVDIIHSLSNQCRYTGHTSHFYSVAQHSVICSMNIIPKHAQWALMHDASEAYVSDLASPIKKFFPTYMDMEEKIQVAIAKKFGLPYPMPKQITEMDYKVLATEKRDLLGPEPASWGRLPNPLDEVIVAQTPLQAKASFTKRFKELFGPLDNYCMVLPARVRID